MFPPPLPLRDFDACPLVGAPSNVDVLSVDVPHEHLPGRAEERRERPGQAPSVGWSADDRDGDERLHANSVSEARTTPPPGSVMSSRARRRWMYVFRLDRV